MALDDYFQRCLSTKPVYRTLLSNKSVCRTFFCLYVQQIRLPDTSDRQTVLPVTPHPICPKKPSPAIMKLQPVSYSPDEAIERAQRFADEMARRRTVRHFDTRPIPDEVLDAALRAAASAPSGANRQPWRFVVVRDAGIKSKIRTAAEAEEHEFYTRRATPEWLEALVPFETNEHKPFLEEAPALIAIFLERYGLGEDGKRIKNYYALESVGIATGFLIAALHHAGVATLTHTPSPMGFLNEILDRPRNETPFLLLVAGYPIEDAEVPDIEKLPFDTVVRYVG